MLLIFAQRTQSTWGVQQQHRQRQSVLQLDRAQQLSRSEVFEGFGMLDVWAHLTLRRTHDASWPYLLTLPLPQPGDCRLPFCGTPS